MADNKVGSKGSTNYVPLIAAGGLAAAGLWWWMNNSGSGGGGGGTVPPDEQASIDNAKDAWAAVERYITQIYANGRTPTAAEEANLKAMIDAAALAEAAVKQAYVKAAAAQTQKMYRDLGYYCIIPPVVGFMGAAALWVIYKARKPPSNPNCPVCGVTATEPEAIVQHAETAHSVTEDLSQLAMAESHWLQQPNFTMLTVATYGQVYGLVYSNISPSWGLSSLTSFFGAACGAYAAEIGTAGSLASLQQCALALAV